MGMTVEEYRKRMMDAFHNADCEGLIALVVSPTEKEFRHLEWLLKTHYKTPKDQYEARLKADMVAMLEEIVLGIDEMYIPQMNPDYMSGYFDVKEQIKDDIQQKIDKLKEKTK